MKFVERVFWRRGFVRVGSFWIGRRRGRCLCVGGNLRKDLEVVCLSVLVLVFLFF